METTLSPSLERLQLITGLPSDPFWGFRTLLRSGTNIHGSSARVHRTAPTSAGNSFRSCNRSGTIPTSCRREKRRRRSAVRDWRYCSISLGCHGPPPKDAGQAHRDSFYGFVVTVTKWFPVGHYCNWTGGVARDKRNLHF